MTTEKIIDRVRKLLELSKSGNENEAAVAAARAAELMVEHQIAEAQLVDDSEKLEPVSDVRIGTDGKAQGWRMDLATGIANAFGGKSYYYSASEHRGASYWIVAPESAQSTIDYMFQYLTKEVKRLANECYKAEVYEREQSDLSAPPAAKWKSSFRRACAEVIAERLSAQRKKTITKRAPGGSNALLVLDKQKAAVTEYVENNLNLGRGSGFSGGHGSQSGSSAGRSAGQGVGLGGGKSLSAGAKRLKG